MPSTLGFALLALLAREPLSGYDIARHLELGVGPFWHAGHSQIYPALADLEGRGLVSFVHVPQQDRPDKKVYSLTEAGLAALRAWVVSPLDVARPRDELTLRGYAAWLADPAGAAALFREHERVHRGRLATYETYRAEMEAAGHVAPTSPAFADYAALRRGIGHEREIAEWCGWLAGVLEAHAAGPRPSAAAAPAAPAAG